MFIAVTYGMPYTTNEKPPSLEQIRRHALAQRFWEHEHLFDSDSHYRLVAKEIPQLTLFERFLTNTFFNPNVPFHAEWQRVGDFEIGDLVAAVEKGLEHDDDIIQQWFGGTDVVKLLTSARNWEETLLAVEAIGGGHEAMPEVAAYVDRMLENW